MERICYRERPPMVYQISHVITSDYLLGILEFISAKTAVLDCAKTGVEQMLVQSTAVGRGSVRALTAADRCSKSAMVTSRD